MFYSLISPFLVCFKSCFIFFPLKILQGVPEEVPHLMLGKSAQFVCECVCVCVCVVTVCRKGSVCVCVYACVYACMYSYTDVYDFKCVRIFADLSISNTVSSSN